MTEDKSLVPVHTVTIKGRNSVVITGMSDLESFDEEQITLFTSEGEMVITGENLHIGNINVDRGELFLDGCIESLEYTDNPQQNLKLWEKIFR